MLHCGCESGKKLTCAAFQRNDAAVQKAQELAQAHGIKAVAYKVNGNQACKHWQRAALTRAVTVTSADEVQAAVDKVVGDFGRIDVFVANAGMDSRIS